MVAAWLVALADTERADALPAVAGFAPLPRAPLPFASQIIASDNDPYCAAARADALARQWGSADRVACRRPYQHRRRLWPWPEAWRRWPTGWPPCRWRNPERRQTSAPARHARPICAMLPAMELERLLHSQGFGSRKTCRARLRPAAWRWPLAHA